MNECKLCCCNIKLTFKGKIFNFIHNQNFIKKYQNKCGYIIIPCAGAIITLYANTNTNIINCTGIKYKSQISHIKFFIKNKLKFNIHSCTVNNSLFNFKIPCKKLKIICEIIKQNPPADYIWSFRISSFPAIFLKPIEKNGSPTVLIFSSGKCVLIGGKNIPQIIKCQNLILNMLK